MLTATSSRGLPVRLAGALLAVGLHQTSASFHGHATKKREHRAASFDSQFPTSAAPALSSQWRDCETKEHEDVQEQ
jgi:hypothetical protein